MNLNQTAKIISYLFVPPFLNLVIFIYYSLNYEENSKLIYSIIISLLFGVIFPILTFVYFRKKGKILNNDATVKEERTVPYIYGIIYTLLGVIISGFFELNPSIILLWMSYLICSIALININRFWKVSAHSMGAAIPLGASFFIGELPIFFAILILVSWSRFYLKVHSFAQIVAGAFIGFGITFILIKYCL